MKHLRKLIPALLIIIAVALAFSACSMTGGGNNNNDEENPAVDELATEGIIYEISEDGAYATVTGYEGTENNIVISSVYQDTPVMAIGEGAFEDMRTLLSVSIPVGIVEIGDRAFSGCEWLTEIELPEGISSIGASAFDSCSALESVTLPATLERVGSGAFELCSKLDNVYISSTEAWFEIDFASDSSCPLYYADNLYLNGYEITELTVPGSVRTLSRYLIDFDSLEALTISLGVSEISKGALSKSTSLSELTVPFIGGGSDGTDYLGYIFGADSYKDSSSHVPAALKTVKVTGNKNVGDGAFYELGSLTAIELRPNVAEIGKEAFFGCTGLTSFTLSSSTLKIGLGAFGGCTNLTELSLPFIGGAEAENCYLGYIFGAEAPADSAAKIPASLKTVRTTTRASISDDAFVGASSITTIEISRDCVKMGLGAFADCTSLEMLSIPFAGSSSTENRYFAYLFGAEAYTESNKVPASLKTVNLTSDKAVAIGEYAFYGCSNIAFVGIPMGIKTIEKNAFEGCSGLTAVLIPYTVETIAENAFLGYTARRIYAMHSSKPSGWSSSWKPGTVRVSWEASYRGETDDGFIYSQTLDKIEIAGYTGELSNVTIPASINGYTVIGIGDEAFASNVTLKSISFPVTIKKIGYKAFTGCYNLDSITLPENLEIIGEGAFYSCGFTEITIPKSVTTIEASAISYCSNLSKIIFEDGSKLQNVGSWAFRMNQNLAEVYISDLVFWCSLSFVDEYSNPLIYAKKFYVGGELLTTIAIPEGVTAVKPYCFTGGIPRAILLPSSVSTLEANAFRGCTSLAGIYLHEGIASIGDSAFFGCSRLTVFSAAEAALEGWSENWNYSNRPVVFGCVDGGITYDGLAWIKTAEGTATIYGYTGSATALSIPESISSTPVTGISSYAFRGITSIERLIIPASVTRISNNAFYECSSLISVTFENPENWRYSSNAASASGTELSGEELALPDTAAQYLIDTYAKYHWFKLD